MDGRAIVVRFLGDPSNLNNASNQGAAAVGRFSGKTQKFATAGIAAVGGLATAWVGMVKAGLGGLQEGEDAEARFNQEIGKAPRIVRKSHDALMALGEQTQKLTKFTYEDTLAAAGFLASQDGVQAAVKGGVASMEDLTKVSLDLATKLGKDAAGGATALSKALAAPEKASGALRKMGINLTAAEQKKIKAWTKSGEVGKAQALILDQIKAKTEGAAEAAGGTMTGKIERAKNAFGEFQEGLAAGVLPVLTKFLDIGSRITSWMADNPGKVKVIVIALGGLALAVGTVSTAIKLWTFITKVHTAIMWALNVAMFANPIPLVVAAVIALGVAMVIAYKKSETFRNIIQGVIGVIKTYIGIWVSVAQRVWDFARAVAGAAANAYSAIVGKIGAAVTFVKGVPGKILAALKGLPGSLTTAAGNAIAGFVQGIRDKAGDIVNAIKDTVTDKIPGFVKKALGISSPSKVTARLGRFIAEGFAQGISGSKAAIARATEMMLEGLRAKVDAAKEMARGIRESFRVDLSATDTSGATPGPTLVQRLTEQAKQAEAFTKVIARLRKAKLRESVVEQFVSEGPGSLAAATEALGNVGAVNKLTGRIGAAGNALALAETKKRTGLDLASKVDVKVSVQLDGKELRAIVKQEQEEHDRDVATRARTGAYRKAS